MFLGWMQTAETALKVCFCYIFFKLVFQNRILSCHKEGIIFSIYLVVLLSQQDTFVLNKDTGFVHFFVKEQVSQEHCGQTNK